MSNQYLSRRRFLALTGTAVGAAVLAPTLTSCSVSGSGRLGTLGDTSVPATTGGPDPTVAPDTTLVPDSTVATPADNRTFNAPTTLVIAASGGLLLQCPSGDRSRVEIAQDGKVIASFSATSGNGVPAYVADGAFAPDGTVWLVDRNARDVVHLDASMRLVARYSQFGSTRLHSPIEIEALSDGRLVMSDSRVGVGIVTVRPDGTTSWDTILQASQGSKDAHLLVPRSLAVAPDDVITVYAISDPRAARARPKDGSPRVFGMLYTFDSTGTPVGSPEEIDRPVKSVAIDDSGRVYVLDGATLSVAERGRGSKKWANWELSTDPATGSTELTLSDKRPSVPQDAAVNRLVVDRKSGGVVVSAPGKSRIRKIHLKGAKPSTNP